MSNLRVLVVVYNNVKYFVPVYHEGSVPSYDEFMQTVCAKFELTNPADYTVYSEDKVVISEESFKYVVEAAAVSEYHIVRGCSSRSSNSTNPATVSCDLSTIEQAVDHLPSVTSSDSTTEEQIPVQRISLCDQVIPLLKHHILHQKKFLVKGSKLFKLKKLDKADKKLLIRIVTDHLLLNRPRPKKADKIAWAQATVELFPMLRVDSSETPYEAVYNPINKTGALGNRLKTIYAKRRAEKQVFSDSDTDSECNENDVGESPSRETLKELLKTLHPEKDREEIRSLTADTYKLRQGLLQSSKKKDILIEYPRFADTPELIQEEFERLYPGRRNKLFEYLTEDTEDLLIRLGKNNQLPEDREEWPKSIQAVISWLSHLPATSTGRGCKEKRKENPISSLIVFTGENSPLPVYVDPRIVAHGISKSQLVNFYVSIDKTRIVTDNTFLGALDVLYKMHHVFDISYNYTVKAFFTYFDKYIFKIEGVVGNTTVNNCHLLLTQNHD